MVVGTIGQLNERASVRRFQMDDVTFTFVVDGAMSMAPQMFLNTIPPAYGKKHPEELDRYHQVVMSAGAPGEEDFIQPMHELANQSRVVISS